jgi:hypothetical protein
MEGRVAHSYGNPGHGWGHHTFARRGKDASAPSAGVASLWPNTGGGGPLGKVAGAGVDAIHRGAQ